MKVNGRLTKNVVLDKLIILIKVLLKVVFIIINQTAKAVWQPMMEYNVQDSSRKELWFMAQLYIKMDKNMKDRLSIPLQDKG